ncbi:enolase-phosphatase E1-like [Schistocerca gregaria]|uniref:enolase-phosphatase E1-like n=1 Tax=Schistocerca gregaria TaxID=7010 RepID=UPI00211E7BCA|nr:enolase-phosphatase E1-like [Schistocerca gregaria]
MLDSSRIRVVLLDIEGTVTPIAFVHKILFSYFRKHVLEYLKTQLDSADKETQADVLEILNIPLINTDEAGISCPQNLDITLSENRSTIIDIAMSRISIMMDENRKDSSLKRLQGRVWKKGFESRELVSEVYPDVLRAFDRWKASQTPIFIYSSGSINAQKLLFEHTKNGSLLPYIAGHFDTSIGHKLCVASYQTIWESIRGQLEQRFPKLAENEVLFGTDNIKEAQSAKEAGMSVFLSIREGNEPVPSNHGFEEVDNFDRLWELYNFDKN